MVKGLIFDVDGTLVDSMPDFVEMMTVFLQKLGLGAATEYEARCAIGNGAKKSMENLLRFHGFTIKNDEQGDELFKIYMDIYNAKPLEKSCLWQGVASTLQTLKQQNYILAACTNKPHLPALNVTKRLGIYDYFKPFYDAETMPYLKPDGRLIPAIAKEMALDRNDCIVIGDTAVDVQTAKNAGIKSVLVSYGYETSDIHSVGADIVIDSFGQLPDILKDF